MKNLMFKVVYLGSTTKIGKSSGNPYTIAKFVNDDNEVYEFFVQSEKVEALKLIKNFSKVEIWIDIISSKGEVKVMLQQITESK
jgi:hypothetical protein